MPEQSPSPLQSRKFIAFLASEFGWKLLAVLVLFWGKDSIPAQVGAILLAIILVAGFVEVAYIGSQAILDKYLKLAQIAANAGPKLPLENPDPGYNDEQAEGQAQTKEIEALKAKSAPKKPRSGSFRKRRISIFQDSTSPRKRSSNFLR